MSENTKLTESQTEYAFQRAVDAAVHASRDCQPKEAAAEVVVAALEAAKILNDKKRRWLTQHN